MNHHACSQYNRSHLWCTLSAVHYDVNGFFVHHPGLNDITEEVRLEFTFQFRYDRRVYIIFNPKEGMNNGLLILQNCRGQHPLQ